MLTGKLHILHTNDIHSHFANIPYLANGIRKLKEKLTADGEVVVVDIGDHVDRMSVITEATWGQANIEVMNQIGYDLAAIGNNEGITFPKEKLMELYKNAQFKVICGNLRDKENNKPPAFLETSYIQQIGDVKVGWIGMTAPYSLFYDLLGWEVLDPFFEIKNIVKNIREKVDFIVLMSHLGLSYDRKLASEMDGIDLILGAHTHHLLEEGERVNQTFIIQAGKFGNYMGSTTLEYDVKSKKIVQVHGRCYPASDFAKAGDIAGYIEQVEKDAEKILSPPVTNLQVQIPIDWERESPLGNLLAKGIRDWVEADISLVNSGQILFSLPKGPVTKKDLLQICPHPINPCKLQMPGSVLKDVLEQSLDEENIYKQIKGFGFRGSVLGWMCVDGMFIQYNQDLPKGKRILRIDINGRELEENRLYSVGTIDMFTFSWIFPHFKESKDIHYYLPEFIRDILSKELQSKDALLRSSYKRWIQV
ncbi:bifunctional metallophosphatase/5'-nucleotidase [Ammoniphilus resinae]|uniref:2',3'-cyclic-nucleotide 2'-phosphodiesterase (5'-nucleotidase family) n=1 Tax=Ammoniphilus resinae TaxID=861532 RepID=A0ABS4GWI8_9BACL|nr:bifunctional UDP-sugar hydrolase/5'-nucleotidase [Ammoniphilus resinae]MBP1934634.1 2',3'-cyclic-nucleotide 2'-phosphodiesterase (5'-nucleotidase family) [Ammoniphilus resinae]